MTLNNDKHAEANIARQIESQLAEGHRLLELDIRNPKELERAAARRSIWVETNVALLKSCPIPDGMKDKFRPQLSLDSTNTGDDFQSHLQSFRDITKIQMSALEDVLSLVPKPQENVQREDGGENNTSGSAANLSLKEKLERHPVGVAALIALASITSTIVVMTWIYNKSEEILINKYETQINGLKNEFDAKQRNDNEIINKLKEKLDKSHATNKK